MKSVQKRQKISDKYYKIYFVVAAFGTIGIYCKRLLMNA